MSPRRPFMECRAKTQEEASKTIEGQRGTGIALSAHPGRVTHPFDLIEGNKSGTIGAHPVMGSGYTRNIGLTFKRAVGSH